MWNAEEYLQRKMSQSKQTWHCRECNRPRSLKSDYCQGCQKHWTATWQTKRRSGSRTKSQGRQEKQVDKKKTKDQHKAETDAEIFSGRAPWIPTTPRTRLVTKSSEPPQEEEGQGGGLPPQPVMPPPPSAPQSKEGLKADEAKLLTHIRALGNLGCDLPFDLQQQMAALEEREKESAPVLSHGHLNKLRKLQTQLQTLAKRVAQADTEWQDFQKKVLQKLQDHAGWYQEYRMGILDQYNQKATELELARREVSQASQILAEQVNQAPQLPPPADTVGDVNRIAAAAASAVPCIALDDAEEDDEMDEIEPQDEEDEMDEVNQAKNRTGRRPIRPQAFSSNRSPTKVAQAHLKPKVEPKGESKSSHGSG